MGNYLAVWDTFLEYRVCLYTLGGTHVATLTLDDAGRPVVAAPLSSDECSRAIEPSRQPRRVLTHTQRSAPSWKRGAGTLLGVCHVTWHPSSEFLAVGGFDERVCVLTAEDWTVAYTLDTRLPRCAEPLRMCGKSPRAGLKRHRGKALLVWSW